MTGEPQTDRRPRWRKKRWGIFAAVWCLWPPLYLLSAGPFAYYSQRNFVYVVAGRSAPETFERWNAAWKASYWPADDLLSDTAFGGLRRDYFAWYAARGEASALEETGI